MKERKRSKARSGIAWSRQFRELQDKLKVGIDTAANDAARTSGSRSISHSVATPS